MATLWETCCKKSGHSKASWVSHIPSHLHNSLNAKQRGREGCAGTTASCQQPDYSRSVRTGWDAGKTSGAEQNSEDGAEARKGSGLTGPYWTIAGVVHSL